MKKAKNKSAKSLYVAPSGNDNWSGRLLELNAAHTDGPLATLARAQIVARGLQQAGGVTVTVRGGEYPLRETLTFTAEDSGTAEAPVVYRVAEGEQVRLSGGARIADWKPVTDAEALKRQPEAARGAVFQADLRAWRVRTACERAGQLACSNPLLNDIYRTTLWTLENLTLGGYIVDCNSRIGGLAHWAVAARQRARRLATVRPWCTQRHASGGVRFWRSGLCPTSMPRCTANSTSAAG